jgi:hypothetical protein
VTRFVFRDDEGRQWSVTERPAAVRGDRVRDVLEFRCETGEVRVSEVLGLAGQAWPSVQVAQWRAILRHAIVVRRSPTRGRETDIA